MDAAASVKSDAEFHKLYDLFLKIEDSAFPTSIKQRHSVIKYTKLPDIDFDSRVTWHEETFSLQPRLRRFVTINEPKLSSSRSLKPEIANATKKRIPNITKRKIVTIEEDDEYDLHPKFSHEGRRPVTKSSCRAVGSEIKQDKFGSQRSTSRLTQSSKSSKDIKLSAKSNLLNNKKENNASTKLNYRGKYSVAEKLSVPYYLKSQKNKEKEGVTRSPKSVFTTSKINVSKNIDTPSENDKDIYLIKNKLSENWNKNCTPKKIIEKHGINKFPQKHNRYKIPSTKEMNKPVTIIHVPLDVNLKNLEKESEVSESVLNATSTSHEMNKVDCSTEVDKVIYSKDMSVGTETVPRTVDQFTEIDTEYETICKCVEQTNICADVKKPVDNLDIPNLTLINDKTSNTSKENEVQFCKKSLPNMQISTIDTQKFDKNENENFPYNKGTSYIISRATLTYTTKKKINFHVVGTNENVPNDISTSPIAYPMNVVSLFKREANNKDLYDKSEVKIDQNYDQINKYNFNSTEQTNSPFAFDSSKLVKPSDIISTIEAHNGFLQNEYICEQFQRELNFIDSFFESLQYLEHCSLAEKCLSDSNVENWIDKSSFDLKKFEYESLLSKFDNEIHVDNSETMASKSLCLLNLLIRDEQRRAKNLLFVLKMREDALKNFTKSQILWLENKKKQDNIDIPTLKKKQRGALLKLQHECGEMQRMRKALLTLSEKRKGALIKTKKNIELNLKNNIGVDQIILGKKKIKRTVISDRSLAPIKCFDLSSSGCDDSTTSRPRSETPVTSPDIPAAIDVISRAEKSVQTGDSVLVMSDQSTNTADENFVIVDGGYLNILFHNLSLPQIFSSGKQYEVNEEALKNIVQTTNTNNNKVSEAGDIQRFMEQIKNCDGDRSTSPSTAHSLVEEFDYYYKGLLDEDAALTISDPEQPVHVPVISEIRDTVIQLVESSNDQGVKSEQGSHVKDEDLDSDKRSDSTIVPCSDPLPTIEGVSSGEVGAVSVAGPLPVPAGAAATPETQVSDTLTWMAQKSSSTSTSSELNSSSSVTISSIPSNASPVHFEAEELRRQQLAIEKEIKALQQQQQCQLLVVREIPDKPPPPYTPPNESRAPKPPRMFLLDDATEEKIRGFISEPSENIFDTNDPFDIFVKDFCQETLINQTPERSEKPWHSCNLLPQKPPDGVEKIVTFTTSHISEVLKGVTPAVVSGVAARRSDHIDDILFAEWRQCEPEWTTLHADEAVVKNQLFESIFQRILTETVDEYKKTVLGADDEDGADEEDGGDI